MITARGRRGRAAGRTALVLGGAGTGVLALAGAALAHVTITPPAVPQGSSAELTFKVPNEEPKAATVEVQLQVPVARPIVQFLVKPVPGWTVTVQTVPLAKPVATDDGSFTTAVSEVTWKGGEIRPGEYQDFSVSANPLPFGVERLVFKAVQTYSNGDVVRWIDVPQQGQPVPEHPAPVLVLTPPGAAGADGTGVQAAGAEDGADTGNSNTGSSNAGAVALGAAGLAAGLLGLASGGSAWLRGRRRGGGALPVSQDPQNAQAAKEAQDARVTRR